MYLSQLPLITLLDMDIREILTDKHRRLTQRFYCNAAYNGKTMETVKVSLNMKWINRRYIHIQDTNSLKE